eukprot:TRINITY_DN11812_c0_g1_i1.p1 TRINITY_DN11812_c0_g1~~TRINITY_DN11812_c0_g1_i1.p1  ORF type:complete len:952 (+),score=179.73 TRINITY_DN11812_c0_g1_i1:57-2858(+)
MASPSFTRQTTNPPSAPPPSPAPPTTSSSSSTAAAAATSSPGLVSLDSIPIPSPLYKLLSAAAIHLSLGTKRKAYSVSVLKHLLQRLTSTNLAKPVDSELLSVALFCGLFDADANINLVSSSPNFVTPSPIRADSAGLLPSPGATPFPDGACASLSQLLSCMKISLIRLCVVLQYCVPIVKDVVSESLNKDVDVLEKVTSSGTRCFGDYLTIWDRVVMPAFPAGERNVGVFQNALLGAGWLLYLLSKAKILTRSHSEGDFFALLVCCVRFIKLWVKGVSGLSEKDIEIGSRDEWQSLCADDEEKVRFGMQMYVTAFTPFLTEVFGRILPALDRSFRSECVDDSNKVIYHTINLLNQSIMKEIGPKSQASSESHSCRSVIVALGGMYDRLVVDLQSHFSNSSLWVDERVFLQFHFQSYTDYSEGFAEVFFPSDGRSSRKRNRYFGEAFSPVTRSPSQSPAVRFGPIPAPWTPYSKVEQSVSWLTASVSKGQPSASSYLVSLLKVHDQGERGSCVQMMEKVVSKHVMQLHEAINSMGMHDFDSWSFKQDLALKLFYRFIEKICQSEMQRAKHSDPSRMSQFLNSESFYSALVALSFEIIIDSYRYKVGKFGFPYLLPFLSLSVLEFWKVLESTLRSDSEVPLSIRNHIVDIENRIIANLIWEHANESRRSFSIDLSSPQIKTLLIEEFDENKRRMRNPNEIRPKPSKEEFVLIVVYRKLLKYVRRRLEAILESFPVIRHVAFHIIHKLAVHTIIYCPELLLDNHVDVLLLCSIYSVCRLGKIESVKFQSLVVSYLERYPANKSTVVQLPTHKKHIIQYYNTSFLPANKTFIVNEIKPLVEDLASAVAAVKLKPGIDSLDSELPQTPKRRKMRSFSLSPRVQVEAGNNVFISPLTTTSGSSSTSGTPSIYSFGESPCSTLRMINDRLLSNQRMGNN